MEAGSSTLHEVARPGQLQLCVCPPAHRPHPVSTLPLQTEGHQRGLAVAAGLGGSAMAMKTSSGPSDHVICSLAFVCAEAQRGSGTGEGSSLDICMLEGCPPSHLALSEYIGAPLFSLILGEILGCRHQSSLQLPDATEAALQ